MTTKTTINGKLTKRASLRGIYERAVSHIALKDGKDQYSMAYLERRLDLSEVELKAFLNWFKKHEKFNFKIVGRKVQFQYWTAA